MSSPNINKPSDLIEHLLLVSGLFYKNELIEMVCCSYDIGKKQIYAETSFYIQPKNLHDIKELMEKSQIPKNSVEKPQYISIEEAIEKLNKLIKENYINHNDNFGIVYVNNDLMNILRNKLKYKNYYAFNLFDSYNEYYQKKFETLNKILSDINLKPNNKFSPCPKELNTMARIVNKMIKDGKKFSAESINNQNTNNNNLNNKEIKINNNSYNNINNKQLENNEVMNSDISFYYIRFKNFPDYINKIDVKELLYQFEIDDNDIVLSYDIFGRKTGDVIIRLYNVEQYKEIFTSYNFYYFNDKYILETFDSNSQEFITCSHSIQFSFQNLRNRHLNIFLKISNIPPNTTENEIKNFFSNNPIVEYGIKFNKSSLSQISAIVVFETEEGCFEALQKNNGRLMKNQSISLKESNLSEFEDYASSMAIENWINILCEKIVLDDVKRSLFLKGLPLDVSKNDLLKYLVKFNINHSDLVVDEKILQNYGSIIIKFNNEEIANKAKTWIQNNKFNDKNIYVEHLLQVVNKGNNSLN